MRIRTLFFATYRDLAGAEALDIDLPTGATAGDLVARLRQRGRLAALPSEPALAVNEEYAPLSTGLSDGDEVALLPPVAGG
ncbi:MAG: MoaD/ThiS family protein [Gemmatimonadetes bacterium]|nr:MoaD/ThiS family protein [Gemmatimonadota bacterium]